MTPIFNGGITDGGGYARLLDDGAEWYDPQWNVEFNSQEDLTAASYYFYSNNCQETIFLINKQFLPLHER